MPSLHRHSGSFRPYMLPDGGEVRHIVVYSGGQVHYESGHGWLDHYGPPGKVYDVSRLDFHGNYPVRANKINLDRTDNFFVKMRPILRGDRHYAVYLYGKPYDLGVSEISRSDTEVVTARYLRLPFSGALWVGSGFDRPVDAVVVQTDWKTEHTVHGRTVEALHERLRRIGMDWTYSDVARLLKYFSVKPREPGVWRQLSAESAWQVQQSQVPAVAVPEWVVEGDTWTRTYQGQPPDEGEYTLTIRFQPGSATFAAPPELKSPSTAVGR